MNTLKNLIPVMMLASACAAAVPSELRDARIAYERVSTGEAAQRTPADVHKAHEALMAAEAAWKDDPKGYHTLDLAYVAQRKAEIAEGKSNIAREAASKQEAQKDLIATQSSIVDKTRTELSKSKTDLDKTQTELAKTQTDLGTSQASTKAVAAQLTVEQQARRDAEKRTAESQAALAKLAAVKEEARGLVITLSGSVLFRSDAADLLPEARGRLDQVADALLQTKERTLVVEGHTDAQGSAQHNLELSQRRAESVRQYLASRGYPADKMSANGLGSQRSIADNKTAEGRANNRRVEIVVKPLSGN